MTLSPTPPVPTHSHALQEVMPVSNSPEAGPNITHEASPNSYEKIEIGRVVKVGSSTVTISINKSVISKGQLNLAQIGTILKIQTLSSIVVTMVSSLTIGAVDDEGLNDGCMAQLNILGEITTNLATGYSKFFRGVRSFPVLNEAVFNMSPSDLEMIFNKENETCIDIGHLQQDGSISAKVRTDDLLSKHFAIIGSTGSGKSCTVALVLRAILEQSPQGHIVLFDPHNEYSKSFGNMSEVISNDTLDLPLWMFDFVETVELLTSDIKDHSTEEQDVLHEILLKAKRLYDRAANSNDVSSHVKIDDIEAELQRATHITLDSPVPYRIRDVLKLIDHEMGKLENNSNLGPYKRLKRRILALINDPGYKFIFRNQASPLPIEDIIGRIFRLPVQGKPISILDFSAIPTEALNIVVSVVSRLAFELAIWSERKIPILLVCEEAHRYIPRDKSLGFHSTRRIIGRIAKEGRKYGVSLAIVSQRPSELETSTLSQCSTIFSMRLSNELDQNFVKAAVPDGASELLSFLPSLGTAETMVFGESVNLPMRVILNTLAEPYRPHSSSAQFTELWNRDIATPELMNLVYNRWRARSMIGAGIGDGIGDGTMPNLSDAQHTQPHHGHQRAGGAMPPMPQHAMGGTLSAEQALENRIARSDLAHHNAMQGQGQQGQGHPDLNGINPQRQALHNGADNNHYPDPAQHHNILTQNEPFHNGQGQNTLLQPITHHDQIHHASEQGQYQNQALQHDQGLQNDGFSEAMRQKILESSEKKPFAQSLPNVKTMLNSAFNRDM